MHVFLGYLFVWEGKSMLAILSLGLMDVVGKANERGPWHEKQLVGVCQDPEPISDRCVNCS